MEQTNYKTICCFLLAYDCDVFMEALKNGPPYSFKSTPFGFLPHSLQHMDSKESISIRGWTSMLSNRT